MPNIITNKYFHANDQKNTLSKATVDQLFAQYIDSGLLEHETCDQVVKLIAKTMPAELIRASDKLENTSIL